MPLRQLFVEPDVVLTHKGVTIYRAYTDDDVDQPEPFVFTTNLLGTDSHHPDAFDIRDIEKLRAVHQMRAYPDRAGSFVQDALVEAVEAGLIVGDY